MKKRKVVEKLDGNSLKKDSSTMLDRSDIRRKDARADYMSLKYSAIGRGLNTRSQKEFKPLALEHGYRSQSVA